jgi:hypothetical protein
MRVLRRRLRDQVRARRIRSRKFLLRRIAKVLPMSAKLILQIKNVFGGWEDTMTYSTVEQYEKALPYWRKDTIRDIRLIERTEKELLLDKWRQTS